MFTQRLIGLTALLVTYGLVNVLPTRAELFQGQKILLNATEASQNLTVRGYVKGTVAFFKAIGDRDSAQHRCMGYGSLEPDHIIDVQKRAAEVKLQVKSNGIDTTLVVLGPGKQLFCADDSLSGGKDAGLLLKELKAGSYKVWIGSFDPGPDFHYQLNIQTK